MKPICCHGVLMEINGFGALLQGPPSSGKSELALELLRRGHRLVADDVVLVSRRGETLVGTAPTETHGRIAVRGLGILVVDEIFGQGSLRESQRIELIIDRRPPPGRAETDALIGHDLRWTHLAEIPVPTLVLTGEPGAASLPTRTECLVRHFALHGADMSATSRRRSTAHSHGEHGAACD